MPYFDITEKRPRINIFKINGAYYFKYFFDDPELFRELEPFYEKQHYRFKIATVGELKQSSFKEWFEAGE